MRAYQDHHSFPPPFLSMAYRHETFQLLCYCIHFGRRQHRTIRLNWLIEKRIIDNLRVVKSMRNEFANKCFKITKRSGDVKLLREKEPCSGASTSNLLHIPLSFSHGLPRINVSENWELTRIFVSALITL